MTILSAVRDRLSGPTSPAGPPQSGETPPASTEDAQLPFAGYDGLDDKDVVGRLSDHSQVELEAVESYERTHESREVVLDKLRYMRQREPLPDYDTLDDAEILAALKEADMATIKKVRGYERKFANRPTILDEVMRVHHERREAGPASAPPGNQPLSAATSP